MLGEGLQVSVSLMPPFEKGHSLIHRSREECHSVLYRNTTFYASNLDTLLLFWERRSRLLARHNSIVHLSHYNFTTQDMTELHRLTMSMNPCCLHFCGMGGLWEQALKGDIEMKQPPTCLQWLSSISRLLERTTAFELRVGLDAIAVDDPLRPWEELANGKMAEECTPHRCLRACDLFPLHGCRHKRAAEIGAEPGVREDNLSDWAWHYDMYGERCAKRYAKQARTFEKRLGALTQRIVAFLQ